MSKERKVIIEQIRDLCASVVFAQFENVLRSRNYRVSFSWFFFFRGPNARSYWEIMMNLPTGSITIRP